MGKILIYIEFVLKSNINTQLFYHDTLLTHFNQNYEFSRNVFQSASRTSEQTTETYISSTQNGFHTIFTANLTAFLGGYHIHKHIHAPTSGGKLNFFISSISCPFKTHIL